MLIRPAAPEDATAIAALSRELAVHVGDPDPGADPGILLECGFGPDRWFECLVAADNERILGFALFCRHFEAHTRQRRLWIGDLSVTRGARRHGIGQALVAAVRARAAALGCAAVDLELARDNDLARGFWRRLDAARCDAIEPLRLTVAP
jgi:ribosomal protein S18 acetylase RimI-like enzyme